MRRFRDWSKKYRGGGGGGGGDLGKWLGIKPCSVLDKIC